LKVLITGANGFVGKSLTSLLKQKGYEIISIGFGERCDAAVAASPDLTDFQGALTFIKSHGPSIILQLAGLKDVFLCEENKVLSHKLNVILNENMTEICSLLPSKLIFISSDYVFDGENGPFNETSIPNPSTQYGIDKLKAEQHIQKNLRHYAILRTSGIFGMKTDFVSTVIEHLSADAPFSAYNNLINTPTFIEDFANMLHGIIKNNLTGHFHCSGREALSRFEFARMIARVFSFKESLIRSTSLDFTSDIRPRSLVIDSARTYHQLNYFPEPIEDILLKHKKIWM
jgi:dTDP-4-dehydrorhamnose reductase